MSTFEPGAFSKKSHIQRLRQIQQDEEDLVIGYTRIHSDNTTIPQDVTQLLILYYFVLERWDTFQKGNSLHITDTFRHIVVLKNQYVHSVVGTQIIASGCHSWSFKLNCNGVAEEYGNTIEQWLNVVGIVDADGLKKRLSNSMYSAGTFFNESLVSQMDGDYSIYAFVGMDKALGSSGVVSKSAVIKYGEPFIADGDILEMEVDLDNAVIRFRLNGQDLGVAYDDIDANRNYKMWVALAGFGVSLEIVAYSDGLNI